MRLLADIALRALSPGINDPTTAVMCIHYLGACLAELVGRAMPSPERRSSKHGVSVLVDRVTFAEHLDEAFGELITFVSGHPLVIMELASVLERAADCARNVGAGDRGDAIDRLTQSVRELAQRDAHTEHGRTMAPVDRGLDQYGGDELRK